jgi:hypothetical protein
MPSLSLYHTLLSINQAPTGSQANHAQPRLSYLPARILSLHVPRFPLQSPNERKVVQTSKIKPNYSSPGESLIVLSSYHTHDFRSSIGNVPLTALAPIPACYMRIVSERDDGEPSTIVSHDLSKAIEVRIGDRLRLEIEIEQQSVYGLKVTNCIVRDGLNWTEQPLLNPHGCPVDEDILGQFRYSANITKATVSFQAHKFPYTSSVYYQCNVRLCLKHGNGCSDVVSSFSLFLSKTTTFLKTHPNPFPSIESSRRIVIDIHTRLIAKDERYRLIHKPRH